MVTKSSPKKLLKRIGSPKHIHEGLVAFSHRVQVMEARRAEFTTQHPNKWIAMDNGDIVVVADTIEDVLQALDEKQISRRGVVIEYMETERRNLVL